MSHGYHNYGCITYFASVYQGGKIIKAWKTAFNTYPTGPVASAPPPITRPVDAPHMTTAPHTLSHTVVCTSS